jgi:hypothetical protein
VCDPQTFEKSNINRVYGSRLEDDGLYKVDIARRLADEIGLGTVVHCFNRGVTDLDVAERFRDCDVIFGCTDDEWGRAVLTKLAISYLIPVFDMGVVIDSKDQTIGSVRGRVTTLISGSACLFCRGVISGEIIASEIKHRINPHEYDQLKKEGYARELPGVAPSVITFTSAVASAAVSELLHRISGFMGRDRTSTEVLLRLDESKVSRTSRLPLDGCWCGDAATWAEGDKDPFLNMTWIPNDS